MRRGLVIGKFLPIHEGHIALIRFSAAHCDELIVSMSYTPHDPIDPQLRFSWIQEIFKDHPAIRTAMVLDDFDDEALPWDERIQRWTAFIKKTYPPIDILFSSEDYGTPFASGLGAECKSFDPERKLFPVSGTRVRQNPFQYWDYIPAVVRPYFVKKICLYGSESTGKSTLAIRMAEHYHTTFVPEVARELITSNDFTADDIIKIGHAHFERIESKLKEANKLLFCDTDAITTQIYSRHYLGTIPDILYTLEKKVHYDLYFLMDIDVPWVEDGLRDLGHQRQKMFDVFREELVNRDIPYILVRGTYSEREVIILEAVDKLLREDTADRR